jgi:hypothetical protein
MVPLTDPAEADIDAELVVLVAAVLVVLLVVVMLLVVVASIALLKSFIVLGVSAVAFSEYAARKGVPPVECNIKPLPLNTSEPDWLFDDIELLITVTAYMLPSDPLTVKSDPKLLLRACVEAIGYACSM